MSQPTDDVQWSTDVATNVLEPSTAQKQAGFNPGDRLPAGWENWWKRAVARWITWLNSTFLVQHSTAGAHTNITGTSASFTGALSADTGTFASGAKFRTTSPGNDLLIGYTGFSTSYTPSVGLLSGSGITVNAVLGRFTRIGSLVYLQISLDFTFALGATGTFSFSLPYTMHGSWSPAVTIGQGFFDVNAGTIGPLVQLVVDPASSPGNGLVLIDDPSTPTFTVFGPTVSGVTAGRYVLNAQGIYFTNQAF